MISRIRRRTQPEARDDNIQISQLILDLTFFGHIHCGFVVVVVVDGNGAMFGGEDVGSGCPIISVISPNMS